MTDTKSIKLALTNRINRPDEYMMNPFPEFEDDYFVSVGNPYLIPETVRNLELGYTFTKDNNMFSSNLYYRQILLINKFNSTLNLRHHQI